jgi:DNA-binding winged helix-turn-helix (wHTH) protein
VTGICPCCGGKVDEGKLPIVDLNTNRMSWRGTVTRLQATHAELLFALVACYPRYASHDYLISSMWGDHATEAGDPLMALRVLLSGLRRMLKPTGFSIDVTYSKGWVLAHNDKVSNKSIGHKLRKRAASAALSS